MSILKPAKNKMAYAKVGIYGEAGSGKTVTASKLAIGLHKQIKSKKPVAFFDTEPASCFVKPLFDKAGIDLLVADESRALKDLMLFLKEAEEVSDIAIIDSISHVWKDAQASFLKSVNDKRRETAARNNWTFKPIQQLEFQDWRFIKDAWGKFTNRYLTSNLHVFVLGRAGTIYQTQENERTGKLEIIQGGTKMATEKELAYEPSLLIEMTKVIGAGQGLINRAFVEKDRNVSDPLTGMSFDRPDFKDFKKHFDFYNIGGEHFKSMDEKDSTELYQDVTGEGFSNEQKQRQVQCEVIKDLFVQHDLDGTAAKTKKQRSDILNTVFNTGSWTEIESTNSRILKEKVIQLKELLSKINEDNSANEEQR